MQFGFKDKNYLDDDFRFLLYRRAESLLGQGDLWLEIGPSNGRTVKFRLQIDHIESFVFFKQVESSFHQLEFYLHFLLLGWYLYKNWIKLWFFVL